MKKTQIHRILSLIILLTSFMNGSAQKNYYTPGIDKQELLLSEDSVGLIYNVYLLGDIKNTPSGRVNLQLLQHYIDGGNDKSAVVFLGDLLYPLGLPDSSNINFSKNEENLKAFLTILDGYTGKVFFLPGNHDWAKGREQGWESVKNEERYIQQYLHRGNVYLPDRGCPGPVEVELTQDITLIIFDSQWWFQKNTKPGPHDDCGFEEDADLFIQIEDALRRNKDKKVIFAAHHPLYSVGKHGGYFPASRLLFPLLDFKNWMYLPLPGFLYTAYRKYLGNIQDLSHPEYKIFRETMECILRDYPNVIYAAGHEHNLQYFEKDSLHHIISGGGGRASFVAHKKGKTDFAFQHTGFNKLSFYLNGDAVSEFIVPNGTAKGKTVFRKKLYNKAVFDPSEKETIFENLDFSDSTLFVKISDRYDKGKSFRFWMGNNYRDIWATPVKLPVFDIGKEKGGLTILKRGGGQQTRSIRMEDRNGKQYVLRSVNKYADKVLGENFQSTIAADVVQDGISASNPYASATVPVMADAVGVMHTNPKIVWVPDDPRLGIYRKDLANNVFLFEERPAGNREDVGSFEKSTKIINTAKAISKTQSDHNHRIDQNAVVRARLFDMLINDWDRHDDQWRWASFKKNSTTTYRPIPRDRDQVFFVNEGVVMAIATLNWPMRKFQGFDFTIDDVRGLGYNARYFDRSFMTEPDINDWVSIADDMQNKLTDTVIHKAIQSLPKSIYDLEGENIENKLKARRNRLEKYATDYYRFLSKNVDVVGTNKRELFNVKRLENGNTQVSVFAMSNKKGKIKEQLYNREFILGETNEIRLYGLKGKDFFKVAGTGKKGIKIRIIGGKGNDSIVDISKVRGPGKKTIVYDRKDKHNGIVKSSETRIHLSKNKSVTTYNRKQYKFNKTTPLLKLGYNIDDGVLLGGGAIINRYNFRDSTIQKITGNLAFQTGAFAVDYSGLFTSVSQTFDLKLKADISFPQNVDNYYGIGNNSKNLTDDKKYYRVRYKYAMLAPKLQRTVNSKFNYSFGAFYQYFMVTDTADRFIGDIRPTLPDTSAYLPHHYTGISTMFDLDTRSDKLLPKRGVKWETQVLGFYSIREAGRNFIKLRTDLSFYLSFRKDPRTVFVFRFGGAGNIGEYEFYHANFLGGKTNLRGFRSNRFAGDASFFQNTEIRFKLMNIKSYFFNGQTGLFVFNDVGWVWAQGENSKKWHDGYGIGVWLAPFDFTALTMAYNRSSEENILTFSFKFLF